MNLRNLTFPNERCALGHQLQKVGMEMDGDGNRIGCYRCRRLAGRRLKPRRSTFLLPSVMEELYD